MRGSDEKNKKISRIGELILGMAEGSQSQTRGESGDQVAGAEPDLPRSTM